MNRLVVAEAHEAERYRVVEWRAESKKDGGVSRCGACLCGWLAEDGIS